MPENKSSESRRKLLKSIAAGSGVVAAGKSLPELWRKPVVNSVMLPAHAATTGSGGNTDEGCPAVTLPDIVVKCADPDIQKYTNFYVIDDVSSPCPVVKEIAPPAAANSTLFSIGLSHIQNKSGGFAVRAFVGPRTAKGNYSCGEIAETGGDPLPWPIKSLSGADWQVTFNAAVSKGGMSITNFVFVPA